MRRFECTGDGSSKFWEVEVEGKSLTVRFGKLGTDGQVKVKTYPSSAAATKEADKLIAEKTRKGYVAIARKAFVFTFGCDAALKKAAPGSRDMPAYTILERDAQFSKVYDRFPEQELSATGQRIADKALAALEELAARFRQNAPLDVRDPDYVYGYHADISVEQMEQSFRDDGFEVVRPGVMAMRPLNSATIESRRWIAAAETTPRTVTPRAKAGAAASSRDDKRTMSFKLRKKVSEATSTQALAISPDGRWVATTNFDQKLRIYDPKTLELVKLLHLGSSFAGVLCFSPDSRSLMAGGKGINRFDTTTWKKTGCLNGHKRDTHDGEFSPDGKTFYSCSGERMTPGDHTVRAWDVAALKESWRCKNGSSPAGAPSLPIQALAVSPDGKSIAWGDENAEVVVLDKKGKEIWRGGAEEGAWNVLAFSPSGDELYAGGDLKELTVFNPKKDEKRSLPLDGDTRAFALTRDGKTALVGYGGEDPRVVALDTTSGKTLWKSAALGHPTRLVLSPDEQSFYVMVTHEHLDPRELLVFDRTR